MRTLYCFNNSGIKFQTTSETEFLQYEIQATSKGFQICYGEFFPYKRDALGTLILDQVGEPIPLSEDDKYQLGLVDASKRKEHLKSQIRFRIESITNVIQANYTSAEKQSFPIKELEAREYQAEKRTQADCMVLTNEAKAIYGNSFSSAQFSQIVTRVLAKSDQFKMLIGTLAGIRNKLDARIDSGELTIDIDAEFSGVV